MTAIIVYVLYSVLVGIAIGQLVERARWRKNVDVPHRILSMGKFYKVYRAEWDEAVETNEETG